MNFRDDHVFIMAPPRSGTRMLTRALGRSPGTYLITEHRKKSKDVPEETNQTSDHVFWRDVFGLQKTPLAEVSYNEGAFSELNRRWSEHSGGKRLILKNPKNVVRARELRRAFPNSKFIWLVRNPWAVIQSMMRGEDAGRKLPMFLNAKEVVQHSDHVLRCAASWAYAVEVLKELRSNRDIVTCYEALVSDPRSELSRISEHVEVAIDSKAYDVPEVKKEDYSLVRYLLKRSPQRQAIEAAIAPGARQFGYPSLPPGNFAGEQKWALKFLMRSISSPDIPAPYEGAIISSMRKALVRQSGPSQ